MASGPNFVEISCSRAAIVSSASSQEMRSKTSACFPWRNWSLRNTRPAPHGIQHPLRGVNKVEILRHLGAKKSAGDWMIWIALNFCRAALWGHRDMHAARVRAVQRANCMHNLQGIHTGILGLLRGRNKWLRIWSEPRTGA